LAVIIPPSAWGDKCLDGHGIAITGLGGRLLGSIFQQFADTLPSPNRKMLFTPAFSFV
jgi:hypothetical protein